MNILHSIASALGIKKVDARAAQNDSPNVANVFADMPVANWGTYADYLRASSGKLWATWKACDIVAEQVASTPWKVTRGKSTEATNVAGLTDRLLVAPNPTMTWKELLYLTTMHVKITGNAYWLKASLREDYSQPVGLIPINPKLVEILADPRSGMVIGYKVTVAGRMQTFDSREIVHFKKPHPDNAYYGIGELEAGMPLVSDIANRGTYQEQFWKNNAQPSALLSLETDSAVNDDDFKLVKTKFQNEYGGVKNAGKIAWLVGKWKYNRLGLSAEEMQAIEATRQSVEYVFTLHGVPLSVAGIKDAANYATAEIDMARFKDHTVRPAVDLLQDTINTDIVQTWGDFKLQFNITGMIAVGGVLAALAPGFDRGLLSINEARAMIGLPPVDDPIFGQRFIQSTLVPLDLAGMSGVSATDVQKRAEDIVARSAK